MCLPPLPTRHVLAAVLLALLAVLGPGAGQPVVAAEPAPVSVASEVVPTTTAPQLAPTGRPGLGGPDDGAPRSEHPGPVLDALVLAPPAPPAGPVGPGATAPAGAAVRGPEPGRGSPADPRGPPAA